jgi:hypothetical protein
MALFFVQTVSSANFRNIVFSLLVNGQSRDFKTSLTRPELELDIKLKDHINVCTFYIEKAHSVVPIEK